MRHRKAGRKLNRNQSHRKALFKNMARALVTYEHINTTEAKAKELRGVVDKLITLALKNDLHAHREAYKVLGNHKLVQKLFDEIGPRYVGGQGGYTRIIKLSQPRKGDCAPMVVIELTKQGGGEAAEAKPEAETKAPAKKAAPKKDAPKKAEAKEEKESAKKAAPKKTAPKKAKDEEPAEGASEEAES